MIILGSPNGSLFFLGAEVVVVGRGLLIHIVYNMLNTLNFSNVLFSELCKRDNFFQASKPKHCNIWFKKKKRKAGDALGFFTKCNFLPST